MERLKEKARHLKGCVDAVNVTDNQTAVARMASWAASLILLQEGLEPSFQMVCRDRNRLAMQADILGIYAHGIRNMLCLSGDHQIEEMKEMEGVSGVHLMAIEWEHRVPEITERAGMLPRPQI